MKKTPKTLEASRKYNKKNRVLIRERNREYRLTHKDQRKLYSKKYREENKEKIKQQGKEYYAKNKEKILEYCRQKYLRSKSEREDVKKLTNKTMFGKQIKTPETKVSEVPDLVIQRPNTVGMPGFTEDPITAEETVKASQPAPVAPEPAPVAKPAPVAPKPAPVVKQEPLPPAPAPMKEQYQVVSIELLQDGLFRYVIITNKNLGEVGGVYEA